jgi:hemerythrin-like domain-containing protein
MAQKDPSLIAENDPISIVLKGRWRQREMCDGLELLADQLANDVDQHLCSSLLQFFSLELPIHHSDEEAIYDLVRDREAGDTMAARWIEQALLEHRRHNDYAHELAEPLSQLAANGRVRQAEALGYLLRCAFESIRRHLDWEELTLFSGYVQFLDADEIQILAARIARNHSASDPHLRLIE